jgi:signal transduction histidine kinase
MIEEIDRANSIISEFLSLAKNKLSDLKPGSLNDALAAILPLLQADALRTGHSVEFQAGRIPAVDFDEKELRQLVLNLVRNALEATPAGGAVTIATSRDGDRVLLAVRDTGPGIPKHVIKKIGTPFVTTKENGTGLGLSVCYRIAERHRAEIDFATGNNGTTFRIRFPLSPNGARP